MDWVPMVDLATGNWRGIAEKAAGPEVDLHEIHGAHWGTVERWIKKIG